MTTEKQTTEAAPKSGAASRRQKPKVVKFRGLKLKLPKDFPALAVSLRVRQIARDDGNPMPMWGLLEKMLGADQFDEIVEVVEQGDNEDFDDLGQLITDIFAEYGMTPGESPASAKS